MADQNTRINGRYAPTVNYSAAVKAPTPTPRNIPKYKADVNIDLSGLGRAIEELTKAKPDYNGYVLAVDEIVQGQRQGRYNYEQAETRIRALTDQYMAQGYDALELAKRREKFDGGLYALSQQQQKIIANHETKRQTAEIEEFRAANDYAKGWTDSRVKMYIERSNQIQDTVNYYNTALSDMGLSDEDREKLIVERDKAFDELGVLNMHRIIQNKLNAGEEITQEFFTDLGNMVVQQGVANGMDYREATLNKDAMMRSMDVGTLMQNKYKDIVDNTEAMKKAMNYLDAGTQQAVRSIPEGALMYNIPHEVIPYLRQGNENFLSQFANKVYNTDTIDNQQYLLGQPIDRAIDKGSIQVSSTVLKANLTDSNYPLSLLSRQAVVFSQDSVDYNGDLKNLTPDQAEVMSKNADDMLGILKDPALARRMQQAEPDLKKRYEDNTQAIEGAKAYADAIIKDPTAVDNLNTLINSFQADRLRYDESTGNLVMTEEGAFNWKDASTYLPSLAGAVGRIFSNDETLAEVDKFNSSFAGISPTARKGLINNLSNGAVKPLAAGEKVVNREDQSLFSKAVGGLRTGATNTLKEAEALMKSADRLEQSVKSAEAAGAVTEEGKLERDRKAIAEARAKAQELRGSAKVSGSISIAGASLRPIEDSDGQLTPDMYEGVQQVGKDKIDIPAKPNLKGIIDKNSPAYKNVENRIKDIESSIAEMDNADREYDANEYLKLSTERGVLLQLLDRMEE